MAGRHRTGASWSMSVLSLRLLVLVEKKDYLWRQKVQAKATLRRLKLMVGNWNLVLTFAGRLPPSRLQCQVAVCGEEESKRALRGDPQRRDANNDRVTGGSVRELHDSGVSQGHVCRFTLDPPETLSEVIL
jgi:hypothetical protein